MDRSLKVKLGDVVVAIIDGMPSVKRLRRRAGRMVLDFDNPTMGHLELDESSEAVIWSVVPDLWHTTDPRRAELMRAMDAVNMRYGRNMLAPAGVTYQRPWSLKQDLRSPRWTTRLNEAPTMMA